MAISPFTSILLGLFFFSVAIGTSGVSSYFETNLHFLYLAERIRLHADNIFLNFTEVNDTKETVELKYSRPRLRISASEMKERLERANLEGHGYKKIVYSCMAKTGNETLHQQACSVLCVLLSFWRQVSLSKTHRDPSVREMIIADIF